MTQPPNPLYRPLYIKGNVSFTLDRTVLSYGKKDVSLFGLAGLPWHPLKPKVHFGQIVLAQLELIQHPGFELNVAAHINREITTHSQYMGIRFRLDADQKARLDEMIQKHGYLPAANKRKFPRVPFIDWIQAFPARALVYPKGSPFEPVQPPISTSVSNLSPEGLLLSSDSSNSAELKPGQRVEVVIEPRGWFPTFIRVQTSVRRILDDISVTNGNPTRSFGLQFVQFEPGHQAIYKDLLKDIVKRIQAGRDSAPKKG